MQPVAPPSLDYVPGPEHPPSPDYVPGPEHPPSPVEIPYVLEPEYPEYLVPSDAEVPLEDQPLPADASPTTVSPDYVADSNLDEDPEKDLEDDHADYPADRGDGDDDPSDDDDDDDDIDDEDEEPFEDEEDDDKEEEHLAPADSSVIPIVDHVPPAGDTEAFETDESAPTPRLPHTIILLSQTRLHRARKTVRLEPPMSASMKACIARHVALLSPPLHVPSIPLPLPLPLTTSLTDIEAPLGYRAAKIRMRALLLSISRKTDTPEADVPPQKRVCLTTPAPRFEVGESSTVGATRKPGPTLESDLRRYRDDRALLRARVNTLFEDRPDHRRTCMLLDKEVMYAREAWAGSEDRSAAIAAHVRTLEAQVAALIAQTSSLQTQLTTTLGRIEILEARDPEPQEGPAEAGSSSIINMAPKKRTTRATPITITTPTTIVTDAQFQTLIDRGVAAALAERDANRSRNGDNSNDSGTGGRRQELALMCDRMFPEESDKVKSYIGGLPDIIHGSVKASKPQSMQEAIKFATEMMDKKMLTHAERHEIRSLMEEQNLCVSSEIITTMGPVHRRAPTRAQWAIARGITCFECGVQGHYKSDCPKLKNENQGNQAGNGNVVARAYVVGTAGTNPNSNVVMGSNNGHESRLNIISCTKTQKYLLKGCPIFLAHVTTKGDEDKSKEKRMEDVPIVQDFPEDLPLIPPNRQVEFQIDLIYGGRLTLIKAVLGSLDIYYLSIFKARETILNSMKILRSRFFWGGSQDSRDMAWVKWSQVLSYFKKEGLQIGSLKAFNLALLQKWRWRLLSSPNNMWVNIIKVLHGQEGGLNNQGCSFNGTWSRIIGTSNFLHSKGIIPLISFCFKVGCGTRVCFWKDIWIGDSPLHTWYNKLYRLDQDKDCLIIDHMLMVLSNDGTFAVKSARRLIDSKLLPFILTPTVWDKFLPQKVNIFLWRLSLDRLLHHLNLSSRGLDIPTISCSSCNGNVESADHVFFECDLVKEIWCLVRKWCDISIPTFASYDTWNNWFST
uniref:CCHC-type domain-containing protein n=1 Tax=Tanacetum cinerariifolium TaxID=118510 RepID=A0A6L2NVZ6_TANCI|nr:hypothetical protein [Tanacetum cinerariifolium]